MINKQSYQIQGMRQDNLVATGHSTKFAHEIMNMRLNTIGDYTTAAWTSEKGTKALNVTNMPAYNGSFTYAWLDSDELESFQPLGQAVINDEWVLFGKFTDSTDNILKDIILCLHYKDDVLYGRILFKGDLNFDLNHPIETLVFYENELIQKVYWTDGFNQPRMINIRGVDNNIDGYNSLYTTQFDFVQEVSLTENVEVKKLNSGTGMFPPCTVKYAITYYHKYGQETNIVYDSPLYYPTIGDRGCGPDELSGDSFEITVTGVDTYHGFDYIRLYSIVRTSDNATPVVRVVEDKPISSSVKFIDTNTTGRIVDPSILNYVGGNNIIAETFDQKDNTLFLGNISIKNKSVTDLLKDYISIIDNSNSGFTNMIVGGDYYKLIPVNHFDANTQFKANKWYNYTSQLNNIDLIKYSVHGTDEHFYYDFRGNSFNIKNFKKGEYYRFGVQFQDNTGKWSEVIRIADEECNIAPVEVSDGNYYATPIYRCKLDSSVVSELMRHDYKKARLVCCYTTNADRTFITQGVINQAVYNRKLQGDQPSSDQGSPYAMSSWFFRPFGSNDSRGGDIGPKNPSKEYEIEQKEVQSINGNVDPSWIVPPELAGELSKQDSDYCTRNNYWTLNSPDIEFDESIRTLNWESLKINNVGYFNIDGRSSSIYISATTPFTNHLNEKGTGLSKTSVTKTKTQTGVIAIGPTSHDFDSIKWNDVDPYYPHCPDNQGYGGSGLRNFPIYPFQRQTSLSNYINDIDDYDITYRENGSIKKYTINITQGSKINYKIFANLTYSKYTTIGGVDYTFNQINDIEIFDSNEVIPIIVNNKVYNGNSNFISPMAGSTEYSLYNPVKGSNGDYVWSNILGTYTLERFSGSSRTNQFGSSNVPSNATNIHINHAYCSDPVKITYKSTPHIVFSGNTNSNDNDSANSFYVAEVTRQGVQNRFGGVNNKNNIYLPCGPAVFLSDNTYLEAHEGDHYLMRYDCLKTYPYSTEDVNQIVEIMSFMCETRVNLDGRYDKNRGLVDNTIVLPTNFNLINKSYTQSNNFFSFTELRDDKVATEVDKFPAQITWTKEKISGEDVDAWTNITLASTADANGTLGAITKILSLNDRLYSFQEHGISVIGFNERTAISVENGTPLELAKTGKFTGFNYITNQIGCQNKWSISSTKNGLLWIDDSRQELLKLVESIQSLSTTYGFDAFMIKELPSMFKPWSPVNFDNFVTYYDKLSNDVYYINKNKCLAWNEQTGTFTSFYSYENTPYMASLGSHSVMFHDGFHAARENEKYNTFFGDIKDYWMTLVCDGMVDKGNAFAADKVFNNIEFRADVFNFDGLFNNFEQAGPYNAPIFNIKHVWNGYQDSQECPMDGIRKFNTWRVQLPRHHGTRDRIRNPFCYIKLKQDQSVNIQTDRIILHDLAVYFDMK